MMRDAKPVVYLAGPFSGDVEGNVAEAATMALQVWTMGAACHCPHLNSGLWVGVLEERVFLEGGLAILATCNAILMMPTWQSSAGATKERQLALKLGIPVLYSITELREWMEARVLC